jgi:hypothetical protein
MREYQNASALGVVKHEDGRSSSLIQISLVLNYRTTQEWEPELSVGLPVAMVDPIAEVMRK